MRDVCIPENDKDTIALLNYLYEMEEGIKRGRTFTSYGGSRREVITAEEIQV